MSLNKGKSRFKEVLALTLYVSIDWIVSKQGDLLHGIALDQEGKYAGWKRKAEHGDAF